MMFEGLPTPCYVVDEGRIRHNLEILQQLEKDTGCHVLLAQKAFSMYRLYPMIGRYISGTTASGLYEARLGYEEMGKENHVFAPAYKEADMKELVKICDHIVFNSFRQYEKYKDICQAKGVSVSGKRGPKRSSLGPMRGFVPIMLMKSVMSIRVPGANSRLMPPQALVNTTFSTPNSLNT